MPWYTEEFIITQPFSFEVPLDVTELEVLVIGGGGGGAGYSGGGGGAGGVVHETAFAVDPGSIITGQVGAGGLGSFSSARDDGTFGQNSTFGSLVAYGGAPGRTYQGAGIGGDASGGGASSGTSIRSGGPGGAQGNDGGGNATTGSPWPAGGGGGFDTPGEDGSGSVAGNGGDGVTILGRDVGGGGGGSMWETGTPGSGGFGGGGDGGVSNTSGQDGALNSGGGGGGAGSGGKGGDGGSGIVVIRFFTELPYPPLPPYEPSKEELFTLQNALQLRFAGGETPEQSLGGNSPAAAGPWSGQMENLFRVPSEGELAAGVTQYCCLFVVNDTNRSWTKLAIGLEPLLWIHRGPLDPDAELSIGVDPADPGDPSAVVADEFTAPSGVSFSAPDNEGDALTLGTLEPGHWKAIWLRRVLAPGHAEVRYDRATLALKTEWEPD